MRVYEREFEIPFVPGQEDLRCYFEQEVHKRLEQDEIPVRFAVSATGSTGYRCEVGVMSASDVPPLPQPGSIFDLRRRVAVNPDDFNVGVLCAMKAGPRVYRRGRKSTADFYRAMLSANFPAAELISEDDLIEGLRAGLTRVLSVSVADATILGGALGDWFPRSRVQLLSYLAVRPGLRGQGIGSMLLTAAVRDWTAEFEPFSSWPRLRTRATTTTPSLATRRHGCGSTSARCSVHTPCPLLSGMGGGCPAPDARWFFPAQPPRTSPMSMWTAASSKGSCREDFEMCEGPGGAG